MSEVCAISRIYGKQFAETSKEKACWREMGKEVVFATQAIPTRYDTDAKCDPRCLTTRGHMTCERWKRNLFGNLKLLQSNDEVAYQLWLTVAWH